MSFWTQTDVADIQDPKRKFRFYIYFAGISTEGGGGTAWWAKSINKPSFTIASAEHKYLNHTFYYPGSVTWNEVTCTLVDPVNPDLTATLTDIVQAAGYSPPSTDGLDDKQTMSKKGAVGSLGAVTIVQIDGEANLLESWTLKNAWISDLKYGDLEYGSDDLVELSVTLKYDWASLDDLAYPSVKIDPNGGQGPFFTI